MTKYTTGTATFTAGSTNVTGIGTTWLASMEGATIVRNGLNNFILEVLSPTQLTLGVAASAGMAGTGTYYIDQNTSDAATSVGIRTKIEELVSYYNSVQGPPLSALLASTAVTRDLWLNPTINDYRTDLQIPPTTSYSNSLFTKNNSTQWLTELNVTPPSTFTNTLLDNADAATWRTDLQIPVISTFTAGLLDNADAATWRTDLQVPNTANPNLFLNSTFLVNQRGVVSGFTSTGANQYFLDCWRVVTTNQTVTWTDTANVRQLTVPSGGIEFVFDTTDIETGTYTFSWVGTATLTVNGNSVAKNGTATLAAGLLNVIRFSAGTLSKPKCEVGSVATAYVKPDRFVELENCRSRYQQMNGNGGAAPWASGRADATNVFQGVFFLTTPMRATPTVTGTVSSAFVVGNGNFFSVGAIGVSSRILAGTNGMVVAVIPSFITNATSLIVNQSYSIVGITSLAFSADI